MYCQVKSAHGRAVQSRQTAVCQKKERMGAFFVWIRRGCLRIPKKLRTTFTYIGGLRIGQTMRDEKGKIFHSRSQLLSGFKPCKPLTYESLIQKENIDMFHQWPKPISR